MCENVYDERCTTTRPSINVCLVTMTSNKCRIMECIHYKRLVWQTRTLSNCRQCVHIVTWLCIRLTHDKLHIDLPFTLISFSNSQLHIPPRCVKSCNIKTRVRPIPCRRPIPDTRYYYWPQLYLYVSKHNVIMFWNVHTVCICSELLVTLSKEKLIKTQLHALFFGTV